MVHGPAAPALALVLRRVFVRVQNILWLDKQHHYGISENLIDTCRTLSLLTRDQNFKRLDYVVKIGDNDNYIIAQTKDTFSTISYWIIDKTKDSSQLTAKQIKMQALLKQEEERVDSIFIQIIKWQMITTEYRALLGVLVQILSVASLSEAWEVLEKKISAIHLITETDRNLYREELMKKSDNNEDMDEMIELLAIKLRRKGIDVPASDSPHLTTDREN